MWCKGAVAVCIIGTLIFSGVMVQSEPVAHKNFSEAEEDLFSILAFFSDIILISEQSLKASYESNGTLYQEKSFSFQYDKTMLQNTSFLLQELKQRLSQSKEVFDLINDNVGSYLALKELITPIESIVPPIEDLVSNHGKILSTFENLTDLVNNGTTSEYIIFQKLSKISTDIQSSRKNLQMISNHILSVSQFFTIDVIQALLPLYDLLLDRYESYLSLFVGILPIEEPRLYLFSSADTVYLGENYTVHGYFITNDGFISDQSITLLFDSTHLQTISTDRLGAYGVQIQTSLMDQPICHNLQARTIYQGISYSSEHCNITYHNIPTTLVLFCDKTAYDPYEPIVFKGQLQTIFHKGLKASIALEFAEKAVVVNTNATGHFQFEYTDSLGFGSYTAQAFFRPEETYEPCISNPVNFSVNLPTTLSISAESTTVFLGDDIHIFGQLKERNSLNPLPLKTIRCVITGYQVNTTVYTNETGWYTCSFSTDALSTSKITLYCMYRSDNISLRSCQSERINITIQTGFIASFTEGFFPFFLQYFPPILLIICILLVLGCISVFIYRKGKKKKSNGIFLDTNFTYDAIHSLHNPTHKFKSFFFRSQTPQAHLEPEGSSFRQKIIAQYRLLLRYLSNHGMSFSPAQTSRDIEQRLKQTGSEQYAVESVTKLFEEARYSDHQPEEQDIVYFDKNVFSIITDFKRESK